MKRWEYRNRWALVTGASAGLGEALARALASRGMHLVLTARREERLAALADELGAAHGTRTHLVPLDLGEPGAAPALWREAADGRDIHLLVNNAGYGAAGDFASTDRERLAGMVQLNCTALLELSHLALQGMLARGDGGIINLASTAAFQPLPRNATYAATKAFVLLLSEALWEENRRAGVRVLALCPGRSPTEFQEVAGTTTVTRSTPGMLMPAQVAEAGLRALEKGDSFVIPGGFNSLAATAVTLTPRRILIRALGRVVDRFI